ncbi:MAG: GNAT family N-acetyltransferase [Actinomycetota bacterium]
MTEIRFIDADEVADYRRAISAGFGDDGEPDEDQLAHFAAINSAETSIAAFDRGHMVATFGSYDLDLTLPGGATVAMAGTTHVTVHPTHRRRGILTEMMRRHLDQAVEMGQPLAGLWASEERIYGRFGYGNAATGLDLRIPDYAVELPPPDPSITVHPITPEEAATILPPIYDAARPGIAGALARTENWWAHRRLPDPPAHRGGQGKRRYVMAERDGEAVGYLVFRLKELEPWGEGLTTILELMAADDEVRRALWSFALNVDLYRNVRWWNAPVDEPALLQIDRFRKVETRTLDSMWLRPLDVVPLLQARSYDRDGQLVIEVADRFGPTAGTYRLEVVDGAGTCETVSSGEPDVTLAVEELGRLLLGGVSAVTLARAGLVAGPADAVARLHDLFTTRNQPYCPEVF